MGFNSGFKGLKQFLMASKQPSSIHQGSRKGFGRLWSKQQFGFVRIWPIYSFAKFHRTSASHWFSSWQTHTCRFYS